MEFIHAIQGKGFLGAYRQQPFSDMLTPRILDMDADDAGDTNGE